MASRPTSLFPLWKTVQRVELEFLRWVRLGVRLGDIPSDQVCSHGSGAIGALLGRKKCKCVMFLLDSNRKFTK